MNGKDFVRIINSAFKPFLIELGFEMGAISISGRLYSASFSTSCNEISISYEPSDDELLVMVFCRKHGELSDIDDRVSTPRLSDLNRRYMHMISACDRIENDNIFSTVLVTDSQEKHLLKSAKELRLVLKRYLQSIAI